MSHEDIAAESKSATAGTSGSDDLRVRWWASLWLWPGVVIGLASIAEALFGVIGAILVSGEALAVVALFAGVVIFDRRHRPTVGAAAVCVASLAVLAGLALLQKAHHLNGGSLATETSPPASPANWQWQTISQASAQQANFSGTELDGANLAGLQLSRKDFNGVQANGASFRGADLAYASFRGASLKDACLQGANLTGADLAGADLSGADVAGVTVSAQEMKMALVWPGQNSSPAAACQ